MSWFSDLFALLTTASRWWPHRLSHPNWRARGYQPGCRSHCRCFCYPSRRSYRPYRTRFCGYRCNQRRCARAAHSWPAHDLWPCLGIGLSAPLIALVILAIPSLLAGAYAGVASVDRDTVDAARAMGYTEWQIIKNVELPLGASVLVGGIRSATLQVTATATLAAYTSDIGLGRFIFHGLKARDYIEMLAGSVLVILLALILDQILSTVQRNTGVHSATS